MRDILCLPLAAFAAPENPLFPIASNSHDRIAIAQIFGFALRSNPGWLAMRTLCCLARAGRWRRAIRSYGCANPVAALPHRPIDRQPKARFTSNASPFFITW
jgi:hypothetical protein